MKEHMKTGGKTTQMFKSPRIHIKRDNSATYNYTITHARSGALLARVNWLNINGERQMSVSDMELSAGYDNEDLSIELHNRDAQREAAGATIHL